MAPRADRVTILGMIVTMRAWIVLTGALSLLAAGCAQPERIGERWRDSAVALRAPLPTYPDTALSEGRAGKVTVSFQVDTLGRPRAVRVVTAEGGEPFVRSARAALSQWRLLPAIDGCRVFEGPYELTFRFRMRHGDPALKMSPARLQRKVAPRGLEGAAAQWRLVERVLPKYPAAQLDGRPNGAAMLRFRVAADGSTQAVRVERAVPHRAFGAAAGAAVAKWRFEWQGEGEPQPAERCQTINFRVG